MTPPAIRNAMSVDVEEWFQVQAFADHIPRDRWEGFDTRVEASTDRILARFAEAGVRATFFTLGWVAERHPALVRRIVAAGHELASHGYAHELVHRIGQARFRADIRHAKRILEDVGGVAVRGYRAPTFSVGPAITPWAHRILAEEGHAYSSSVFPLRHDLYGAPEAPQGPHRPDPEGVPELPMTTLEAFGRRLPCAGGGWFRLAPYPLFRAALRRVNGAAGRAGMFYFHPWEIDPAQPRLAAAPARARFRHYTRQASMERRVARLLGDFAWGRVDEVFAATIRAAARAPRRRGRLSAAMAVRIRDLGDDAAAAWDRFVRATPDATFFHLSPWARVIRDAFGHATHYAFAEQDGAIVGVLPLARMRTRLFGDLLASTPFCVYGGAVAATAEAAAALEAHALDLQRRLRVPCLEFRRREAPDAGWQTRDPLYFTFRKPIAITGDDAKDLERNIPRKQRAEVRKAIKRGLATVTDGDVDRLHRIYAESVRNLGSPVFPRRYFRLLAAAFPGEHDVTTVLHEGRPVAAVLNFHFRQEVLPYYGGGTRAARGLSANDLMYWEVMRRAGADRGATLFDFGRSKLGTGAFDFKRNWGFAPTELHYCYRLAEGASVPDNNPNNPKYRLMIAAWKRLPLAVANLIGPRLVRGLG